MNNNSLYNYVEPNFEQSLMVTWDTGKRCNFDCAYCGSDRHDNFSKFPPLIELKKGVLFLKEYFDILIPYKRNKNISINITGGEPTSNPNFINFIEYLNKMFLNFQYPLSINLTTNGSFSQKYIDIIATNFKGITVSYHCDSSSIIKKKVLENILKLNDYNNLNVNLMMHPEDSYWNECLDLIDVFKSNNIIFMPRIINGLHYNDEQSQWLKSYWAGENKCRNKTEISIIKNEKQIITDNDVKKFVAHREMKKDVLKTFTKLKLDESKNKTVSGRHCCTNAKLNAQNKNDLSIDNLVYLGDINFKDWYCGVNWFFLHLESQTDSIFLHQTCQAKFDNTRGPIGKISEYELLINQVKNKIDNKTFFEPIKCPNKKCGCGVCATKAVSTGLYDQLMKKQLEYNDDV